MQKKDRNESCYHWDRRFKSISMKRQDTRKLKYMHLGSISSTDKRLEVEVLERVINRRIEIGEIRSMRKKG